MNQDFECGDWGENMFGGWGKGIQVALPDSGLAEPNSWLQLSPGSTSTSLVETGQPNFADTFNVSSNVELKCSATPVEATTCTVNTKNVGERTFGKKKMKKLGQWRTQSKGRNDHPPKKSHSAVQVRNMNERKRRNRISEKLRDLKELIPHCRKSKKASLLDDAIEYIKSLQRQLQILSTGRYNYVFQAPVSPPAGIQGIQVLTMTNGSEVAMAAEDLSLPATEMPSTTTSLSPLVARKLSLLYGSGVFRNTQLNESFLYPRQCLPATYFPQSYPIFNFSSQEISASQNVPRIATDLLQMPLISQSRIQYGSATRVHPSKIIMPSSASLPSC